MKYDIGKVLFSQEKIASRVTELAAQIAKDLAPGRELLVVGILNGAVFFLTDLVRSMPRDLDVRIDFMSVSSYGNETSSSGVVRILRDLGSDIEGLDVLLVEDIIDTGLTLSYLLEFLQTRRPASLKTCVLLDKNVRRMVPVAVDYCGFAIPDAFVVGYGLDYAGKWRHLPDIHDVEISKA
ncbi:MAG: hypoxanthine phosphoribosyltransferase [Fretibacterium sp.]|nr:hypoxanthine phosphoribosyltransferase [Fretibacterium sp.]